jgi:hypothetical protein
LLESFVSHPGRDPATDKEEARDMHGLHLTADLYQCQGDGRHMLDADLV